MDMSSRRFRDLPGTPSTIDRQNLRLRLSKQSGATAYQFRETKLLFRSKVERLPGEFRSNKIRNTCSTIFTEHTEVALWSD